MREASLPVRFRTASGHAECPAVTMGISSEWLLLSAAVKLDVGARLAIKIRIPLDCAGSPFGVRIRIPAKRSGTPFSEIEFSGRIVTRSLLSDGTFEYWLEIEPPLQFPGSLCWGTSP